MNRKAGFTRAETVLVAGVAALMGAALLPLAVRAQNTPRPDTLQTCQSNLRQIGMGLLQYQADNDDNLPMATYSNRRVSWRAAIMPYLGGASLFRCPDNPNNAVKTQDDANTEFKDKKQVLKPDAVGKEVPAGEITSPDGSKTQVPAHTQYAADQYINVEEKTFLTISYAANNRAMWRGGALNLKELAAPMEFIVIGESTSEEATMPFSRTPADFGRGRALFAGHRADPVLVAQRKQQETAQKAQLAAEAGEVPEQAEEAAPEEAEPEAWTVCAFADGHVKAMRPVETLPFWFAGAPGNRESNDMGRRLVAAEEFFVRYLYSDEEMPEFGQDDAEENDGAEMQSEN